MTDDKTALDALNRLENDALSGRDGYGDARKDTEIIRNFINTRPQPSGDAVKLQAYQKAINRIDDLMEYRGMTKVDFAGIITDLCNELKAALAPVDVERLRRECIREVHDALQYPQIAAAVRRTLDYLAAQGYIGELK